MKDALVMLAKQVWEVPASHCLVLPLNYSTSHLQLRQHKCLQDSIV